jgi:hypothetical protein
MTTDGEKEKIHQNPTSPMTPTLPISPTSERQRSFFGRNSASNGSNNHEVEPAVEDFDEDKGKPTRWSMGVLNDPDTHEVPGTELYQDLED